MADHIASMIDFGLKIMATNKLLPDIHIALHSYSCSYSPNLGMWSKSDYSINSPPVWSVLHLSLSQTDMQEKSQVRLLCLPGKVEEIQMGKRSLES